MHRHGHGAFQRVAHSGSQETSSPAQPDSDTGYASSHKPPLSEAGRINQDPRPVTTLYRPVTPESSLRGRPTLSVDRTPDVTRQAARSSSRRPSRVDSFPSEDEPCDDCGLVKPHIALCNACESIFCPPCWDMQVPHKRRRGGGRARHEKTDIGLAKKIRKVLEPTNNQQKLTELHEDDAHSAWFGIERPQDGNAPLFKDYGRFDYLLAATVDESRGTFLRAQSARDNRTPSLVSFVGQAGAGKSTLIKLLIDLKANDNDAYPTPVVGAPGVIDPTSEDVHLYADPVTAVEEAPLFFADCEGLLGGEREPMSTRLKRSLKMSSNNERSSPLPVSERELEWADSASLRSREFAVTNLYPRLLYTFSDVIVFVLRNPRVIESVLQQLVEWAAAALEMSSNQPVLPHVIIALNASENEINELEWDPDFATTSVLESLSRTLFQNPIFQKYARFWRERERPIETVEQLILSYYSSIRVVRIPAHGRPHLIQAQVDKLYTGITVACEMARDRKSALRMLLDAEELQSYLQYAFDHFALSLDRPFDFVQASFSNSPIPLDFGGNILKLALNLMRVWESKDIRLIFEELSYMVASCIMLDTMRRGIKGTAGDIFPEYLIHLEAALENFYERYWPCEFSHITFRCVNVRSGHGDKGHQNSNGKVFAYGDYYARWTLEQLREEFTCNTYFRLEELLDLLQEKKGQGDHNVQVAAKIHRDDVMAWFYRHVTSGRSQRCNSHSVCLCCLSKPPEHALPCGHVLCTPCIETYGHRKSNTEIDIQGCPLEPHLAGTSKVWTIHIKPDSAGVRVLTLDGGGIRGIMELEILRSIEAAWRNMNGRLSIRSFFDLIVGTSTGGLIAMGLVARNWSIDECIDIFKELCDKAFTRRTGGNIPFLGRLVDGFHHSKYETTPLHEALQTAFSKSQYLFGGPRHDQTWTSPVKVAVTTTIASTSPAVLANYSRQCEERLSYQFLRPGNLDAEFKTWEAARATSAAPRYFKPFHHEASKQMYMDGALYLNNPVKVADSEWKLIWETSKCAHLDIMLSLGTGYREARQPSENSTLGRGLWNHGRLLKKIAQDHIEDALDCEKTWDGHISGMRTELQARYIRYNIEVPDLPSLDEVLALGSLQVKSQTQLLSDSVRIKRLGLRLIATSFYFETEKVQQFSPNSTTATGRILCRLGEGSQDIRELGKLIRDQSYRDKNSFFLIRERSAHGKSETRELSWDVVGKMYREGKFQMRKMNIQLNNKLSEVEILLDLNDEHKYPISGFPRCLWDDPKDSIKSMRSSPTNSRRWAGRSNSTTDQRRKYWQPPDRAQYTFQQTMSNYPDRDHGNGYVSTDQLSSTQPAIHSPVELNSLEIPRPPPQEMDAQQPIPSSWPVPPAESVRDSSIPRDTSITEYYAYTSKYDRSPLDTIANRSDTSLGSPPPYDEHSEPAYIPSPVAAGPSRNQSLRQASSFARDAPPQYAVPTRSQSSYIPYRPYNPRRVDSGQLHPEENE